MDGYWNDWALEEPGDYREQVRQSLIQGGYTRVPPGAGIARLQDEYFRMQRGLLSYDGCTNIELEQFIRDRGLRQPAALRLPSDTNPANSRRTRKAGDTKTAQAVDTRRRREIVRVTE